MSGSLLLFSSMSALFVGVVSIGAIVTAGRSERRQVGKSLAAIAVNAGGGARGAQPISFRERVLLPARVRLAMVARIVSPSGTAERLTRQLDLAGNPAGWPLERVFAAKAAAAVVLGLVGLLFFAGHGPVTVLATAALGVGGFLLPDVLVYNRGLDRQAEIQSGLADALDLLTISVEAGLGFDAALAQVARNTEGPLAGEFFRVLQEMQIGKSRTEAFRAMGERTTVPELGVFVSALVQADHLGIPLARVLREQSKEMRVKRRQRGEEKAMKVPVKMMFPMVVFILPVLFVILVGPGAITMMENF